MIGLLFAALLCVVCLYFGEILITVNKSIEPPRHCIIYCTNELQQDNKNLLSSTQTSTRFP